MKILVSAPLDFIDPKIIESFNKIEIIANECKTLQSVNELDKMSISGWMVNPCPEYHISKSIISQFMDLKVIVSPSTGSTHIDTDYCVENNITVKTLRDTNITKTITASSEFTLCLFLNVVRNFPQAIKNVEKGNWRVDENVMRGREISCLKIGIVGLGRIGGNLARYLKAMGAEIHFFDPNVKNQDYNKHEKLTTMLPICDAVFTCVHVASDTIGMVDSQFINNMKYGSFYINTSRGEIVNEDNLIDALKSGKIKAAGVDVISNENVEDINENKLIRYSKNNNNLLITPHIAGLTTDSETKAQEAAFNLMYNELSL